MDIRHSGRNGYRIDPGTPRLRILLRKEGKRCGCSERLVRMIGMVMAVMHGTCIDCRASAVGMYIAVPVGGMQDDVMLYGWTERRSARHRKQQNGNAKDEDAGEAQFLREGHK